jgi:hypothetical protein
MHREPLGYFITWTCYGTWLPGDDRGWTSWHQGERIPQPLSPDKTVFEIETCDFRLGYSSLVPQITTFSDLSHIGTTASICTVFKN